MNRSNIIRAGTLTVHHSGLGSLMAIFPLRATTAPEPRQSSPPNLIEPILHVFFEIILLIYR